MVTVVTRAENGIPLTHEQVDTNFTSLADAVNNIGADVLADAVAAKDEAVSAASTAQGSAISAANSADAASISRGNAAASAEQAAMSATSAAQSAVDSASAVQSFKDTLATSLGSTLIGWLQNGVGAVLQTIANKLFRQSVTPFDFGGKGDLAVGTDDTDAVRAAITSAAATNRVLDLRGGNWVLTGNISLTGVSEIICGNRAVFFDRRVTPSGYLIEFGTYTGDAHTGRAQGTLSGILVAFRESRTLPADGIYIKGALLQIGHVRAYGYNGAGVTVDSCWDSTITRVSTELCGNEGRYGMYIASLEGDTSNCLHIEGVQCEQAVHRGMNINLIRSKIDNIHAERTYITTLDDGSAPLALGGRYTNHLITSGNSDFGQAFFDAAPTGTAFPGGVSVSNILQIRSFLDYSTISTWAVGGDFLVIGGSASTINTMQCRNFLALSPSKNHQLNACGISGTYKAETGVTLVDTTVGTFAPGFNARGLKMFGGSVDTVNYTAQVLGEIYFFGTSITNIGNTTVNTAGMESTVFRGCNITNLTGGFNASPKFEGGYIANVALVSQAAARLYNVKGGTFDYTGNTGFITVGCIFDTVTKWAVPGNVNYPLGARTERPNFVASAGATYVNRSASPPVWAAITTFPA